MNSSLIVSGQEMVGGVPHVLTTAFVDGGSPQLRVYRVAGASWTPLGGDIASGGNLSNRAMTVVDGAPWVAWSEDDGGNSLFQARVARWTGSGWERVGGLITHDPDEPGGDVAIGTVGGVPHVMFNERGAGLAAHVARWDGTRWEELGASVSAPDAVTRAGSVVDFGGVPHVAWTEQDAGGPDPWRVRVARWSGSAWEALGEAANASTAPRVDEPVLAAVGGRLHVVWRQSERAMVARLENGAWNAIGEGIGAGAVSSARATVVQGTLVVVRVEDGALRVARLRADRSGFDDVGGALNFDRARRAGTPAPAALGQTPWIAWAEALEGGGARVHASRLLPEFGTGETEASASGATLRVPVATFGMPMDVRFAYGRGSADVTGPTVLVTSPPDGQALASATIDGLSSAADYVWRASSGEVTGAPVAFRTAAAAAAATPVATPEPAPAEGGAVRERAGPRRSVRDRVAPDRPAAPSGSPSIPPALQPGGSGSGGGPSPSRGAVAGPGGRPPPASPSRSASQSVALGTAGDEPPRRSRFAASLMRPDDVPLSLEDVARGFGLAMLLAALLGLPARLFNATWKANRVAMAAFFAPLARCFRARRGRFLLGLAPVSALVSALIISFLDPGFPLARGSGAMYLGALLGVGVLLSVIFVAWLAFRHRHAPDGLVAWRVYPGQIAFAALCVAVSRAAHFVPGLIMGMSGDYEVRSPLEVRQRGLRIFYMMRAVAVVALVAWLLSVPIGTAAAEPDAAFAVLVLDVMLAVVAVAGMEYLVFSGIPLIFLDGHDLFTWSRARWAAVWGTALLWFSLVVLNPALSHYTDRARASAGWLATLLAVQAVIAVGLWAFFTRRARSAAVEPAA